MHVCYHSRRFPAAARAPAPQRVMTHGPVAKHNLSIFYNLFSSMILHFANVDNTKPGKA